MVGISCVDWLQVFSFNRILFQYCNPVWLPTWRSWNLYTGIPDKSMLLREFERRPTRFERHPKTPPNEPLRGGGKRVAVDCLNCADWCLLWNDDQFSVDQLSVYMTDYITKSMACAKCFNWTRRPTAPPTVCSGKNRVSLATKKCEQGERRKLSFMLLLLRDIQICISAWRFQDWPGDKEQEVMYSTVWRRSMSSSFSVRWKLKRSGPVTRMGNENFSCLFSRQERTDSRTVHLASTQLSHFFF